MRTEKEINEQKEKRRTIYQQAKRNNDLEEENYNEGWLNALLWVLNE